MRGRGKITINMPISTEGSGTPTMRPETGCQVYGLGAECAIDLLIPGRNFTFR